MLVLIFLFLHKNDFEGVSERTSFIQFSGFRKHISLVRLSKALDVCRFMPTMQRSFFRNLNENSLRLRDYSHEIKRLSRSAYPKNIKLDNHGSGVLRV